MMKECTILSFDETEELRNRLSHCIDEMNDLCNGENKHIALAIYDELKEIRELFD